MNNLTKKIALSAVFIFGLVVLGLAQAPPPPPSGAPGVPIDGGLSLLAAAGIGYGASRYKKYKSSRKDNL
jgi:hypothetical protein